jgi:hypothetical protein
LELTVDLVDLETRPPHRPVETPQEAEAKVDLVPLVGKVALAGLEETQFGSRMVLHQEVVEELEVPEVLVDMVDMVVLVVVVVMDPPAA